MTIDEKKELIARKEWDMFQGVNNEGGRASCQDDPKTFFIMRNSHHAAWPEALLDSYLNDLNNAIFQDRNLMTEKYAWMMKDTAPDEFAGVEQFLLPPSSLAESIIREAAQIECGWMEDYTKAYPKLSGGNRVIRKRDARFGETSFETYLEGELSTYSERTLFLYQKMLHAMQKEDKNMFMMIMEAQVKAYGYRDLDDAEARA